MDEEEMRLVVDFVWLESLLCVSFSVLTLLVR